MPDQTIFGGYPVPVATEAAELPAQMMAFAESIDVHTVLFCTSQGDRDARYSDLPAGAIVSTTTYPSYVWKRVVTVGGELGWVTIHEDTGWQAFSGTAWGPLWSDNAAVWRRSNNRIDINIRATYNGDDVTGNPTNGGNLADILLMTLPSGARPVQSQEPAQWYASTVGNLVAQVGGNVLVTHCYPGGTLSNGTGLYCHLDFRRD